MVQASRVVARVDNRFTSGRNFTVAMANASRLVVAARVATQHAHCRLHADYMLGRQPRLGDLFWFVRNRNSTWHAVAELPLDCAGPVYRTRSREACTSVWDA